MDKDYYGVSVVEMCSCAMFFLYFKISINTFLFDIQCIIIMFVVSFYQDIILVRWGSTLKWELLDLQRAEELRVFNRIS